MLSVMFQKFFSIGPRSLDNVDKYSDTPKSHVKKTPPLHFSALTSTPPKRRRRGGADWRQLNSIDADSPPSKKMRIQTVEEKSSEKSHRTPLLRKGRSRLLGKTLSFEDNSFLSTSHQDPDNDITDVDTSDSVCAATNIADAEDPANATDATDVREVTGMGDATIELSQHSASNGRVLVLQAVNKIHADLLQQATQFLAEQEAQLQEWLNGKRAELYERAFSKLSEFILKTEAEAAKILLEIEETTGSRI